MALTTWKPMTDLLRIHDEMSKIFDEFFSRERTLPRTERGE